MNMATVCQVHTRKLAKVLNNNEIRSPRPCPNNFYQYTIMQNSLKAMDNA